MAFHAAVGPAPRQAALLIHDSMPRQVCWALIGYLAYLPSSPGRSAKRSQLTIGHYLAFRYLGNISVHSFGKISINARHQNTPQLLASFCNVSHL